MLLAASCRLLLLVVALLTTPTPARGAAIAPRGGQTLLDSGAGEDPSGREPKADRTLVETGPESSGGPGVGGPQGSGAPLEQASAITAEAPQNASHGEAWQAGTAEPPVELKPLLDIDQLLAYERRRVTSTPEATSAPQPVTAPNQLAEMVESSLDESTLQGPPTAQRPRQPPRVDPASQKPPFDSTDNTTNVEDVLPQQEEVPKNVHLQQKPTEPQPPRTDQLPLPQTPKVPDTEEDSKHSLPTLEEEINSIFKNNETKVLTTTSGPTLPPVHPTTTNISRPSLSDTDEGLQHILPTLEDAIGSIFKNSARKIPVTTGWPAVPPVHQTVTEIRRPSLSDAEDDFKQILPNLEEAIGSIFEKSEAKVLTTTSRPALPPVHQTVTDIRRPSLSDAEEDLKHIFPTLEEALGSIFENSEAKLPTTTSRPALPPEHPTVTDTRRPSLSDAEDDFKQILPNLEEAIGSIFENSEAKVLTTTSRPALPPVHQTVTDIRRPSLSDAEEDLKHILPTLEEALGSIFENSEAKLLTTTSRPAVPSVYPTVTDIRRPSLSDAEDDLKQILPSLEEALSSIFENSEAKILTTTSRPAVPSIDSTVTEIRRPSLSDAEDDLKQILPTLEEALGSIFENSDAKLLTTTSRPTHPMVTELRRPSLSDAEDDLKQILPSLEEALGSIFENAEAKVLTTTSRPVPVLPPVRPTMTADSGDQFAAVLPQLEEAIRSVLDEAVQEQEAAAPKHTAPSSAWQPSPQTRKDYGFSKFLPDLERVFGDILRNGESDHNATIHTMTVATSTVKMPVPAIAPTEEKPSLQTNVIEPYARSSHSESLFQALKSTLQDVFNNQEVEAKTLRVKS